MLQRAESTYGQSFERLFGQLSGRTKAVVGAHIPKARRNRRSRIKAGSSILYGLLISTAASWAQGESVLETLVVNGTRTSLPLTESATRVETSAQLPGVRLDSAELLQGLPGVQADSRSNYAQDTRVTLRGFGARSAFGVRGIDLLVDGVPLTTPDGQGQLSSVLLDEVTAVEVLSGPLAALYGNGAGGVIALQTRAPENNRIGAGLTVGADSLLRESVDGQWQTDNAGARLQATHLKTDGGRPHSQAEREQFGGRFYYNSANGVETILRVDTSHDPLLQDPLGLTAEQWREDPQQINPNAALFNTRKDIDHRQVSLTLRQSEGDSRWQTSLWQGARDITQYLAFAGDDENSAGGVIDLQRDFYGLNGNYSQDFSLLNTPLIFTLGAEAARSRDRRHGYVNERGEAGSLRRDESGEVTSRDIYGLLQWQPAEQWNFFGGARHSRVEFTVDDYFIVPAAADDWENPDDSGGRDYSEWSTAFGVNYQLATDWTVFASAGRGFETPTLTEMAYTNDSSGLNTALEVSRNHQQELGLRFVRGSTHFTVTLFGVDSSNELVVDQSIGGRTTYRNAAETERKGAEFSGQVQISPAWSARININYLDAIYSAGEWNGNNLPGVARQNHYLQLRWQPLHDERLTISAAAFHRGDVAAGDDNLVSAPAATTADLAISSQQNWDNWQMSAWLKLANVFDEVYVGSVIVNASGGRSFEPALGRNVSAGVTLDYHF